MRLAFVRLPKIRISVTCNAMLQGAKNATLPACAVNGRKMLASSF